MTNALFSTFWVMQHNMSPVDWIKGSVFLSMVNNVLCVKQHESSKED